MQVNGKPYRSVQFGSSSIDEPDVVIDIPGTAFGPGANTIRLVKTGQGRLYYSLDLQQFVRAPAPTPPQSTLDRWLSKLTHHGSGVPSPSPSGFTLQRRFVRLTSRRNFLWEDTVPAEDTHFNENDSILVRLLIDCKHRASHVMIEEPIPAGCRILIRPFEG